jgi:hypothetical protein
VELHRTGDRRRRGAAGRADLHRVLKQAGHLGARRCAEMTQAGRRRDRPVRTVAIAGHQARGEQQFPAEDARRAERRLGRDVHLKHALLREGMVAQPDQVDLQAAVHQPEVVGLHDREGDLPRAEAVVPYFEEVRQVLRMAQVGLCLECAGG